MSWAAWPPSSGSRRRRLAAPGIVERHLDDVDPVALRCAGRQGRVTAGRRVVDHRAVVAASGTSVSVCVPQPGESASGRALSSTSPTSSGFRLVADVEDVHALEAGRNRRPSQVAGRRTRARSTRGRGNPPRPRCRPGCRRSASARSASGSARHVANDPEAVVVTVEDEIAPEGEVRVGIALARRAPGSPRSRGCARAHAGFGMRPVMCRPTTRGRYEQGDGAYREQEAAGEKSVS